MPMPVINETWLWCLFFLLVTVVLGIDLWLLRGQKSHRVSTREALSWTAVWVSLALSFNLVLWVYLYHTFGPAIAYEKSLEFLVSYLIEKSLSVDNLFVFILIFQYFSIPAHHQRRLLQYGVISAIFMRLVIILFGIWLINRFDWIFYVFGVLLLISALRILFLGNEEKSLETNLLIRFFAKIFRLSHEKIDGRFFILHNKQWYVTPMFIALLFIEFSDLIFAIDSIPAVFAITRDPFIVFTSNVFAILGLRTLYFLISNMKEQFAYLSHGLAIILIFIGIKMLIHAYIEIPVLMTLGFIVLVLATAIALSSMLRKPH